MRKIFIKLLLIFAFNLNAQNDSLKIEIKESKNPIIYATLDGLLGNGIFGGGSLNFQKNNHLVTFRIMNYQRFELEAIFLIFPILVQKNSTNEFALLYGKRWIYDNHAFAISGGLSLNQNVRFQKDLAPENTQTLGFPLELSVHWFKSKKRPFRIIYGLVPVGPPTEIGRSFGFKIAGNISKDFSYLGFGLTFGIGAHKVYR
jgi:hypothetical protein